MTPYKEGDAPDFERDFCCWTRANCYCCAKPFDRGQAAFSGAKALHRDGKPWVHLRVENWRRYRWEAEKNG